MNYRQHLIKQHQARINEFEAENLKYDCLNFSNCEQRTEYHTSLCGKCEKRLEWLLSQIDPAIQWLTIQGEMEAFAIASPGGGGTRNISETSNFAPAALLADELQALATKAANWVWYDVRAALRNYRGKKIATPPAPAQPGAYLTTAIDHLVRQPWVTMLLNGYRDATGQEIRGLNALINDQRAKYPKPTDPEPARPLTGLPCPQCKSETLWLHPAQAARQPITIKCHLATTYPGQTAPQELCDWECHEDAQDFLINIIELLNQANTKTAAKQDLTFA